MTKRILKLVFILGLFVLNGTAQNSYTLKNQDIEFSVDRQGNLVSFINLQTGQNYASGKPMWRLYFDREGEIEIQVLAKDNQPTIQQKGDEISFVFNNLKTKNETLKFALTLKMTLEQNCIRFSSEITNNEPHTIIRELQYPLVANIQIPDDHKLLFTQKGGHIYLDAKKKILSQDYSYRGPDHHFRSLNVTYPIGVAANCYALIGEEQGLYFGSHDPIFQFTCHGVRLYPDVNGNFDELETGLYKYPNCQFGESWKNNTNVVAPYNGDWHQTSKLYRAWADTWWNHSEPPQWVKEMVGFQRMILKHQNGEKLFTYDEFATRIKKAGESVGIKTAFPFGWWNSGMDNGYPDSYFETDPEQGGDKAWKQAVADYQKDGGKVIMYYNGKLIDKESNYYVNGEGKEVCYRNSSGTEMNEAYKFPGEGTFSGDFNPRSFVVAVANDPRWHQQLVKMADHAFELGANCVFYDQMGYAESTTNWDRSKEFPVPDLRVIANKAEAMRKIHDYIDARDKEMAIGVEWITDVTSQTVDFVHGIFGTGTSATGNSHTNFIDWFRYTFPEIIITFRDLDGNETDVEWQSNRAAMLGLRANVQTFRLRGLIDETPRLQQHLAKVNLLIEKYKSFLLLGTYRDTEGFTNDNNMVEARSYTNGNQMAIVMTHKSNKTLSARVNVPGYRYLESAGIGETKVENQSNVSIGENGLLVLVYEKETD
ncbi:DUF6259 domain-containing protein [Gaoshiqia sp. Z1-71]|uniref:DUF6259 domain-containing protein n=1 Tax=Gaoshiqia hydrogeniformans TaxID=3290090 RepID=UPI003BF89A33